MLRQHFGLTHQPLGKQVPSLWDDGQLSVLKERFGWLLEHPGIGLLTGEAGVGKTAALRQLTQALSPHRYQVIYSPETDFGRVDLYRNLALGLGLEPSYRRAQLWRDIKTQITALAETKHILPLWIIDEAQNLPGDFFRDLPAFLNFAFDSRDLMTIWLIGHPHLLHTIDRAPYAALKSRINLRLALQPIIERERFADLIATAIKQAGCQHTLISDSGLELLRQASQGRLRQAGLLLQNAMQLAVLKKLNHLPDDLIQQTIKDLQ